MWGVSPAYFISRFSSAFTPDDMASVMPDIASSGYDACEIEIFYPNRLDEWTSFTSKMLSSSARLAGIKISCFAAHFLLNAFSSNDTLMSDYGIAEFDRVSEIASELGTDCIIVPIPAFSSAIEEHTKSRFITKLESMLSIAARHKKYLALEIMPDSLLSCMDDMSRLFSILDDSHLGLNLDTGHFNAMGIPPHLVADSFSHKIFATHLCDNDSLENLSLVPGDGNINWTTLMDILTKQCAPVSMDIEIICPPEDVTEKYRNALLFLSNKEYKE
ncbi:sugar phosphate isomerase/epimerase family protein [Spirochaetia bacterium 38H-sp]|uniref:Sugar phosphate isomerase/epimerase family protein n=1 Tax=Rarispira pelagica TaxID=3141764 RepID=A0ABU9UB22_9SPIR